MTPYYSDDFVTIYHGDCRDVLPSLDPVETCLTDPPYGLSFMGRDWDHGVPGEHFWSLVRDALLPGAMCLAFGGTRTFHRLTCAIEDAGFEVRDCMMWLYGSGFPKSMNVGQAVEMYSPPSADPPCPDEQRFCAWLAEDSGIDRDYAVRILGTDRFHEQRVEVVNSATAESPRYARRALVPTWSAWQKLKEALPTPPPDWIEDVVKNPPSRPEHPSDAWTAGRGIGTNGDGAWAGWGTALKPAWEPIILAMKPLEGTFAENALTHGVAGLNIDGARIGAPEGVQTRPRHDAGPNARHAQSNAMNKGFRGEVDESTRYGRWPANLVLDEEAAAMLDEQSGVTSETPRQLNRNGERRMDGWGLSATSKGTVHGDSGGASRFFYTSKASRADRGPGNDHPTVKPSDLMKWLVTLTATPTGGTILDPFMGSGTTLYAAKEMGRKAVGIELEERYCEIAASRLAQGVLPLEAS